MSEGLENMALAMGLCLMGYNNKGTFSSLLVIVLTNWRMDEISKVEMMSK